MEDSRLLHSPPKAEMFSDAEASDRSALAGKCVLITGCTNGLGEECVKQMCELADGKRPSKIILIGRNRDLLMKKASYCHSHGVTASYYSADLTNLEQLFQMVKEVKNSEVKIDTCCLNAGTWHTEPVRKTQGDNYEYMYVSNFIQQVILAQEFAPMIPPGGRIAVMGSFTSLSIAQGVLDFEHCGTAEGEHKMILNGAIPYSQSKLMQHMWVKHVGKIAPIGNGIVINVCCPGQVMTNIPTWQAFKSCLGFCYPCVKACLGIREVQEGVASMMFLLGSESAGKFTGEFIDFGMGGKPKPHKNVPMQYYPDQGMKCATSIEDDAQCERLFNETNERLGKLRAKYQSNQK